MADSSWLIAHSEISSKLKAQGSRYFWMLDVGFKIQDTGFKIHDVTNSIPPWWDRQSSTG